MEGSTLIPDGIDDRWTRVRSLRSLSNKTLDEDRNRRTTFSAALEQAEQLYLASQSIGLESRSILLYYSMFQAGRAIAAAHSDLTRNWRLRGHGLKCSNLDQREEAHPGHTIGLVDLIIRKTPDKDGQAPGFATIAQLFGSGAIEQAATIGEVISCVDIARTHVEDGGRPFPGTEAQIGLIRVSPDYRELNKLTVEISGFPDEYLSPTAGRLNTLVEILKNRFPQFFSTCWESAGDRKLQHPSTVRLVRTDMPLPGISASVEEFSEAVENHMSSIGHIPTNQGDRLVQPRLRGDNAPAPSVSGVVGDSFHAFDVGALRAKHLGKRH